MLNQPLRWIRVRTPAPKDWRRRLLHDVVPFAASVASSGAVGNWYTELSYSCQSYIDLYLGADAAYLHTVLRGAVIDHFGREAVTLERAHDLDTVDECILQYRELSTKRYASHGALRRADLKCCIEDLRSLVAGLGLATVDADEFCRKAYAEWLHRYLEHRYSFGQAVQRREQELELTAFLRGAVSLESSTTVGAPDRAWLSAGRSVYALGEVNLQTEMRGHIARYGLDPYERGQVWLALADSFASEEPILIEAQREQPA